MLARGTVLLVLLGCGGGGDGESSSLTLGIVFFDSFDSSPKSASWKDISIDGSTFLEAENGELATHDDHASALLDRPIEWNSVRVSFSFRTEPGKIPLAYLIADTDTDLSTGGWFIGFDGEWGPNPQNPQDPPEPSRLEFESDSMPEAGSYTELQLGTSGETYILEVLFGNGFIAATVKLRSDNTVLGTWTIGNSFHPRYFGIVLGRNYDPGKLSTVDDFKIEVLQ